MAYLVRWTLDGATFPINPLKGALPTRQKNVTVSTQPINPAANPIIYEGRENPAMFSFEGHILSQAHYDFMVGWFNSSTAKTVVDDLGNSFKVYLTNFAPSRKNRHTHPWAMDYQAEGVIV